MKNLKVIIGANFGDEGKGLMTDFFASKYPDGIVVRFNGGSQAGHTVVTPDSIRHVFSHFGSGTLAGLPTYLSEDFIVNPMTFRKEWEGLAKKGITPLVYINPNCMVTTPYDMLVNQIVEDFRSKKHGSCGIGINETIRRDEKVSLKYGELVDRIPLVYKISKIQSLVIARLRELGVESVPLEYVNLIGTNEIILNYLDDIDFMLDHCATRETKYLNTYDNIIFEGAQGLLLDQHSKYFPHVTPSNTGTTNVVKIVKELKWEDAEIEVIYVTRCYLTRHGAGEFKTELPNKPYEHLVDLTNVSNKYQGEIRFGILDMDEMKEVVGKDFKNLSGLKSTISIAVTCLDQAITDFFVYHYDGHTVSTTSRKTFLQALCYKLVITSKPYLSYGMTRETIR